MRHLYILAIFSVAAILWPTVRSSRQPAARFAVAGSKQYTDRDVQAVENAQHRSTEQLGGRGFLSNEEKNDYADDGEEFDGSSDEEESVKGIYGRRLEEYENLYELPEEREDEQNVMTRFRHEDEEWDESSQGESGIERRSLNHRRNVRATNTHDVNIALMGRPEKGLIDQQLSKNKGGHSEIADAKFREQFKVLASHVKQSGALERGSSRRKRSPGLWHTGAVKHARHIGIPMVASRRR